MGLAQAGRAVVNRGVGWLPSLSLCHSKAFSGVAFGPIAAESDPLSGQGVTRGAAGEAAAPGRVGAAAPAQLNTHSLTLHKAEQGFMPGLVLGTAMAP